MRISIFTMKGIVQLFIIILLGVGVNLIPIPEGLSQEAWLYFSIFLCVVIGLIVEPFPPAFIGLLGVVTASLFKVGPLLSDGNIASGSQINSWGLSGFSNGTVWLIF